MVSSPAALPHTGRIDAACGGVSDMAPVGGPIGGSDKEWGVAQGVGQEGTMPVLEVPVVRELQDAQGEDLAGESLEADPGQEEEVAIIADLLRVAHALLI